MINSSQIREKFADTFSSQLRMYLAISVSARLFARCPRMPVYDLLLGDHCECVIPYIVIGIRYPKITTSYSLIYQGLFTIILFCL